MGEGKSAEVGHGVQGGAGLLFPHRRLLLVGIRREAVPKSEGLVRPRAHDGRLCRGHGQVEDPLVMARQLRHFRLRDVLPNLERVVGEAVRGDNLLVLRVPVDARHLALRVDRVHALPSAHVPNLEGPIVGPAARGQHSVLPRTPGHPFDRCLVLTSSGHQS